MVAIVWWKSWEGELPSRFQNWELYRVLRDAIQKDTYFSKTVTLFSTYKCSGKTCHFCYRKLPSFILDVASHALFFLFSVHQFLSFGELALILFGLMHYLFSYFFLQYYYGVVNSTSTYRIRSIHQNLNYFLHF